ncbi:hypothetical protein [Streptomyces sp. NPDC059786]|uniref:hypothetical protein n=1 Tax=Streptomyces sp. NPDC059786 TaxID=3346946 RepID=UPI00364C2D94
MGRYDRHPRSRRRLASAITSAALVVAGGAVVPLLTAGTATAAPTAATWSAATALTGTDVDASVLDVVTAADGSAVTLWNQFAGPNSNERKLYAAVRPADSDTWGAPALLATTPTEAGSAKLHASADGTVTALWVEFPNETAPGSGSQDIRLRSAVLAADGTSWSAPVDVVGAGQGWTDGGIDLAEAPDGTLTAAWGTRATASSKTEVSTATRGTDGTWSAPVRVSTATADRASSATDPSVAVTSDGTAVIAYKQTAGETSTLRTVSKPASTAAWSAPATATDAYMSLTTPELSAADDGSLVLAYSARVGESDPRTIHTATRSAGGSWSAADTVSTTDSLVETPEPLIAPDGDVTLVWVDWTKTFATRTATRDAADGAWSDVRTLSTAYVPEQYDAAIGADGTVHALWTESVGDDEGRVLKESALTDGAWTSPAQLPGSADAFVHGAIDAGDDGTATAVWSRTDSADVTQLYASRSDPSALDGATG